MTQLVLLIEESQLAVDLVFFSCLRRKSQVAFPFEVREAHIRRVISKICSEFDTHCSRSHEDGHSFGLPKMRFNSGSAVNDLCSFVAWVDGFVVFEVLRGNVR